MRARRPTTEADEPRLIWCQTQLRNVRDQLKATGARRTTAAVRRALTSIGGAIRNVEASNAWARYQEQRAAK